MCLNPINALPIFSAMVLRAVAEDPEIVDDLVKGNFADAAKTLASKFGYTPKLNTIFVPLHYSSFELKIGYYMGEYETTNTDAWAAKQRDLNTSIELAKKVVDKYLKTMRGDLPNPFGRFRTQLNFNPILEATVTVEIADYLRQHFPPELIRDFNGSPDTLTCVAVASPEEGAEVSVTTVFGLARILEISLQLSETFDEKALSAVLLTSAIHEWAGHLPSVIEGKELGLTDKQREISAYTESAKCLVWLLGEIIRDPEFRSMVPLIPYLEKSLQKEIKFLESYRRS